MSNKQTENPLSKDKVCNYSKKNTQNAISVRRMHLKLIIILTILINYSNLAFSETNLYIDTYCEFYENYKCQGMTEVFFYGSTDKDANTECYLDFFLDFVKRTKINISETDEEEIIESIRKKSYIYYPLKSNDKNNYVWIENRLSKEEYIDKAIKEMNDNPSIAIEFLFHCDRLIYRTAVVKIMSFRYTDEKIYNETKNKIDKNIIDRMIKICSFEKNLLGNLLDFLLQNTIQEEDKAELIKVFLNNNYDKQEIAYFVSDALTSKEDLRLVQRISRNILDYEKNSEKKEFLTVLIKAIDINFLTE